MTLLVQTQDPRSTRSCRASTTTTTLGDPSILSQVTNVALLCNTILGGIYIARLGIDRRVVVKRVSWDRVAHAREGALGNIDGAVPELQICDRMISVDDPSQEKEIVDLLMEHHHPHIVEYLDVQTSDHGMSFALEFCEDGDLLTYLERTEQLSLPEHQALDVMWAMASALAFIHDRDIAHRDISLENILVKAGDYKLSDFGLACRGKKTCVDRAGKSYYMAPEIVNRTDQYDPKAADVWSLGIVLFILLTSSPLVPAATVTDPTFVVFQRFGVCSVLDAWDMGGCFSIPTKKLLSSMLQIDPRSRVSIHGVLSQLMSIRRLKRTD